MALYDGFFDAVQDEETGEYDREYTSGDFTGYFAQFIGSGGCVLDNPDSFKVRFEDGAAMVSPGYLFIQGFWLKNDADYPVETSGTASQAIVAHLNTGKRMIEIEARSIAQAYPDSLVLGIVNAQAGTAEDTRYNTDICGVIDSAGSLSKKVQYAIHYIDNEVEGKLEAAEADIRKQSAILDQKIAEVQAEVEKLAPPPIGTIKFSASKNVSSAWLRCDGSYINESDYPELVAALGKVSPGAQEFWEGFKGAAGSGLSNGYLYNGTLWAYSATDKKLYGYTGSTKQIKTLNVTGADKLTASSENPVCLSIVSGHLFLAQNQTSANSFVLLENSNFTGSGSVAMTERDLRPLLNKATISVGNANPRIKLPGKNFVPEITAVEYNWNEYGAPDVVSSFILCVGLTTHPTTYRDTVASIVWKASDFSTAKVVYMDAGPESGYYNKTLLRYGHKTAMDLVAIDISTINISNFLSLVSSPNGVYNTSQPFYFREELSQADPVRTSPAAGNGLYIYRAFLSSRRLNLRIGRYNPNEPYSASAPTVAAVALPSRATVFPDSVLYAANQDLWFVFVGTGLAFSQTPENGASWGYFDTQDILGAITQFGCLEYDADQNLLYISGQDTNNKGKLGVMKLPELYNYANDGAWLPMIASDGIPAYIKAKEEE